MFYRYVRLVMFVDVVLFVDNVVSINMCFFWVIDFVIL